MSMSGQRRLELERARAEALRLDQVRQECEALADACEAAIRDVRDVAVQQLASDDLRKIAPELRKIRRQISDAPDESRAALLEASRRLHQAIARAEAAANRWKKEQVDAVAAARQAQAVAAATGPSDGEAAALGRRAVALAAQGAIADALQATASSQKAARAASAAALDEKIRREVVKGLLKTLKEMGFVTVGPQLEAGLVVLEGRLASRRRARFEVSLDGNLGFDLDGYEGRACAVDMEKVETVLRDRFGVKLGPPQVVWKSPDRITKGARDVPTGTTRKR
jgi:hypothetical protein